MIDMCEVKCRIERYGNNLKKCNIVEFYQIQKKYVLCNL